MDFAIHMSFDSLCLIRLWKCIYCHGFLLVSSRRIYACIHESLFWVSMTSKMRFVFALNEICIGRRNKCIDEMVVGGKN